MKNKDYEVVSIVGIVGDGGSKCSNATWVHVVVWFMSVEGK